MQILDRAAIRGLSKVRLVGDGTNELTSAIDAYEKAEDLGLDLVMVNPDGNPPVVKIEDFRKIQYEKKKARKTPKKTTVKEVQFKVNISDNDLQTKISAIERFLSKGDSVKISVRLKGRERDTPERAIALLERVVSSVNCKVNKIPGPMPMMMLEPAK